MRHRNAILAVVLLAGCSSSSPNEPAAASPDAPVTVPAAGTGATDPQNTVDTSVVTGTDPGSGGVALVAGAGQSVAVSGGSLPTDVVDAVTSGGGELIDTSSWDARYETFGLPRITGSGVKLAGAKITVESAGESSWRRTDGLQWLYMDASHSGLDEILDLVALAAGVDAWEMTVDLSTVNGADCVTRTYTRTATWTIEGCAYPVFPGMFATAVTRETVTDVAPTLPDPTVAQVATVLGGTIEETVIEFGSPKPGGVTTLTSSAVVFYPGDRASAVTALTDGPLAGWDVLRGDGADVFTSGSLRWTISDTGAAGLAVSSRVVW